MAGYEGWNLRDRSFLTALVVSVLWHLLWFFSITVVVNPHKRLFKKKPEVVSLGPVLDDTIFRTLVETRTEVSQAFYRRLSDFSSPADLKTMTLPRQTVGNVVSGPLGKKAQESMRAVVGGAKASPEYLAGPLFAAPTPTPEPERAS